MFNLLRAEMAPCREGGLQVVRDIASHTRGATALTVGNFDGCHLGHQALLRTVRKAADHLGVVAAALTFDPHPECFFQKKAQQWLFSPEQKSRAFAEAGLDLHVIQTFDEAFAKRSADQFFEEDLIATLGVKALAVGDNFRFGRDRQGNVDYLRVHCAERGIAFDVASVEHDGAPVSSSRVRREVARAGGIETASALLGRPYMLEGTIRRGDQLGRTLGFPTANLEEVVQLVPAHGIYAGYVALQSEGERPPTLLTVDSRALPAVFSIGIRPTLADDDPPVRIEAHILASNIGENALYGMRAGFYLSHWLREEERFEDLEALKRQIALDCDKARALLGT